MNGARWTFLASRRAAISRISSAINIPAIFSREEAEGTAAAPICRPCCYDRGGDVRHPTPHHTLTSTAPPHPLPAHLPPSRLNHYLHPSTSHLFPFLISVHPHLHFDIPRCCFFNLLISYPFSKIMGEQSGTTLHFCVSKHPTLLTCPSANQRLPPCSRFKGNSQDKERSWASLSCF